jgi:hypothetical protein
VTIALAWLLALPLIDIPAIPSTGTPQVPGPASTTKGPTTDEAFNTPRCLGIVVDARDRVVLQHPWHGPVHKLIGKGLEGRRARGVHVVGGLLPTPTLAAQSGSLETTVETSAWLGPPQARHPFPPRRESIVLLRPSAGQASCASP